MLDFLKVILLLYLLFCLQRQTERIKREKAQARRGDDAEPQFQPESLVAVSRFHGSRLASAPTPPPFQPSGHYNSQASASVRKDNKEAFERPLKVSRVSSGATVAAAIVEAENNLEIDVCFPASGEAFFRTNIWVNLLLGMSLARNLSCSKIIIILTSKVISFVSCLSLVFFYVSGSR